MLNEGNKQDEYLEKKGERPKDTAMRKASSRRGRFSSGDTHQGSERENITWARPGTRPHADSLDRQRKSAHRSERGRKKPQAGSSSEQRRTDDIWHNRFPEDRPLGKYEKIQKQRTEGKPTSIDVRAQKQGLIRKGERRRELRTQAVNAIRRAVGGGYVSEAKVDDRLSADQKEVIRNRRLSPGDRLPVRGETSRETEERLTQQRRDSNRRNRGGQTVRGSQLPKYKKHAEFGGVTYQKDWNPEKVSARRSELRAKRAKNNIRNFREQKTFEQFMWSIYESTGMTPENSRTWKRLVQQRGDRPFTNPKRPNTKSASRREEESTSPPKRKPRRLDFEVREDFVPLTPDKEERVKKELVNLQEIFNCKVQE